VRVLAATLRGCDLFVGADSGPLHLAGAIGVPCVGLYGPFGYRIRGTNLPVAPLEVLPPDQPCPCFTHAKRGEELPCKREACLMMTALTVDMVEARIEEVLNDGWEAARNRTHTRAGGRRAERGRGRAAGADAREVA